MRELSCDIIKDAICDLCIKANRILPLATREKICSAMETEKSETSKAVLLDLKENYLIAEAEDMPICQDTGMAVVFAEVGQDLHIVGGDFEEAINAGVARGYDWGYLRKSVVADPIRRGNTNDNTPAIIHTKIVSGDKLKLTLAPKGFGSENMSAMKMFLPTSTRDEIIDFIVDTVCRAGSKPCPPVILGVGLGGTIEKAAYLSKFALARELDEKNSDPYYAEMEDLALEKINKLGIGPQGFGGTTTALKVSIEPFPTHIAGLPCVVNVGCHATRHSEIIL